MHILYREYNIEVIGVMKEVYELSVGFRAKYE